MSHARYFWHILAIVFCAVSLHAQCGSCAYGVICSGLCEGGPGDPANPCVYPSTGCNSGWIRQGNCCCPPTPILIDLEGTGFKLTSLEEGVNFPIGSEMVPLRVAWTQRDSKNGWLALDRNGNGAIDNGSELFGSSTLQPPPPDGRTKNGYLALAQFDLPVNGGNQDGIIDSRDAVFSDLVVWVDRNHDGISQREEVLELTSLGIVALHFDYRLSDRVDEHGNRLRYFAKLDRAPRSKVRQHTTDVILQARPIEMSRETLESPVARMNGRR